MFKSVVSSLMIGITLISLVGCATAKNSGYLNNFSTLKGGEYLEKVTISPELVNAKSLIIEIAMPEDIANNPKSGFAPGEAQNYLRDSLEIYLRHYSGFKVVKDSKAPLKLETAITKLKPGNRALRWFASIFGAGHSYVQVDGRLINQATRKVLLEFSDRRVGSAGIGLDITGGISKEMIRDDINDISEALAKTLQPYSR